MLPPDRKEYQQFGTRLVRSAASVTESNTADFVGILCEKNDRQEDYS